MQLVVTRTETKLDPADMCDYHDVRLNHILHELTSLQWGRNQVEGKRGSCPLILRRECEQSYCQHRLCTLTPTHPSTHPRLKADHLPTLLLLRDQDNLRKRFWDKGQSHHYHDQKKFKTLNRKLPNLIK